MDDATLDKDGYLIMWVTTLRCMECTHYVRPKKRRRCNGKTRKANPGHCSLTECMWKEKRAVAYLYSRISRSEGR